MRQYLIATCLLFAIAGISHSADWQIETLENGLKVMILENHQVPQVNISTAVKVGAKNETDFFNGATHLLEHLILFRGTEKMTGEELGNAMKRHGAYFNGYTSSDWTDFVISLPKENFEFALGIHADMLFRSNFPKEAVDAERQAVLEEINISEDNPFGKMYRSTLIELYGDHPYSKDVLGPKERVANVPRDSIYAYYKRYYAPNNMTMAIVGDIQASRAMERVKAHFSDFPRGEAAKDIYCAPPERTEVTEIEIKKDVGQAYMMMATIGPQADSADQFPLDVMSAILGNGESSRIWKRLKEELGLVYSTGFSFHTRKYEGVIYAYAILDPANINQAEVTIRELLAEAKTGGFTEKELRKAKNMILTDYYTSMERGLSLADNYAQYDSFIGYQFQENYPANIEQVTLAQLNDAAAQYLNTNSYVKTMVVPND